MITSVEGKAIGTTISGGIPFAGHRPRKRFGQHWLRDPSVLQQIADAGELGTNDVVLEIGPGRGALTERLLATPIARLVALELDRGLIAGLQQRFGGDSRFHLLEGDALALLEQPLPAGLLPGKVVANIPYNITGPLLDRLVGSLGKPKEPPFQRLILLLQKEVAERIVAPGGTAACGALSVKMQLLTEPRCICQVPSRCFSPPPAVASQVVALRPLAAGERRYPPEHAGTIERLLRVAYAGRRKMLRNTLTSLWPRVEVERAASCCGISLQQRAQDLGPGEWVALAAALARSRP